MKEETKLSWPRKSKHIVDACGRKQGRIKFLERDHKPYKYPNIQINLFISSNIGLLLMDNVDISC